jgi:flagellar hook-length control protein FliK
MMPKFQPRLDRSVDSMPISDLTGPTPEAGGVVRADGVDGARPRSPFAELMSATDAADKGDTSVKPEAKAPDTDTHDTKTKETRASSRMATEPFAPSFDLPAFLQVLPRSGNEVAVAAAREPALAAAVRRLPTAKAATEARSVDAPDVAIRLPSFLVPPKVDASVMQPATVPNAAVAKAETSPARSADTPAALIDMAAAPPSVAPAAASAPTVSTASAARTATAALESALRRAAPGIAPKEAPPGAAATAPSTSAIIGPAFIDPLAQGAAQPSASMPMQSFSLKATRPKSAHHPSVIRRNEPVGERAVSGGSSPRELTRLEPSALVGVLQRPFESATVRTDPADRGGSPGRTVGGHEMGSPTTTGGVGAPTDAASMSPLSLIDPGDRQGQASVLLRQPVGTEAWQDELSAQLSFMAEQGEGTEAVMKLAPEELGELEVRVEVRGGEAALQFGVANADARQAVEAAQTKLRDLFTSQGMSLSEFSVFSSLSGKAQSDSSQSRGSRPDQRAVTVADGELEILARPRRSVGVLDLYA